MIARIIGSVGLFFLAVFSLTLAGGEPIYGQPKGGKKAAKLAEKAAKQEFNGQEADVLRTAYVLLNTANGNYKGHRATAMEKVRQACEILDKRIMANGTSQQKVVTIQKDAITAYLKNRRELAGKENEPQIISDAQLYQAGQILSQLAVVMAKSNQPKLLALVKEAIKEIDHALKVK